MATKKAATKKQAPKAPPATAKKAKSKCKPLEIVKKGTVLNQFYETPCGRMAIPFTANAPEVSSVCDHNLPLIPLEVLYAVINWQREIAKKHKCESHTSLFLTKDGWVAEPFHQENDESSMTIKVDYFDDRNIKRYEELIGASINGCHATIHNHVNSAAGQSSVDVEDEKQLMGPHITIGKLNQAEIDFHGRFSIMIDGKHHFIPMRVSDIIALPLPFRYTEAQLEATEKMILNGVGQIGYPEEWKGKFHIKTGTAAPVTPGKQTAAPANNTQGSVVTRGITAKDIGSRPLNATEIDITKAPWSILKDLDCSSYAIFRADLVKNKSKYEKLLIAAECEHGVSTNAIWIALCNVKNIAGIPLDSTVQAA